MGLTRKVEREAPLLLKALLYGLTIAIGDYTYQMDDTYRLCAVGHNVDTGEKVLLVVITPDTLAHLVSIAKHMTDEEYIAIAANVGLAQMGD